MKTTGGKHDPVTTDCPAAGLAAQARRHRGTLRQPQDPLRHRPSRRGYRRVRRGGGAAAHRPGGEGAGPSVRRDSRGGAHPGHRRADPHLRQPLPHRPCLHRLPRTAPAAAPGPSDPGGRGRLGERVPRPQRLAGLGQRQPGLLPGRPHPQHLGQGDRQLLAQPRLPARDRSRPPRGRPPHPRPGHALGLLRRLVPAHPAARGAQRGAGQGGGGAAQAHVLGGGPDRQLSRHPAERVGRRPSLQLLRHLHGPLRAQGRAGLRRGAPVHPGADLQPQRALPLGHPDPLHQPHLRLGLPRGSARPGAGDRRRGDALHLRRAATRDGSRQPRLHRGDERRRRQGTGLHLSHPHLQHHPRLPLGERERRAPVRDDRQVRPALLPELPQLRARTQHGALHVLPPAARPARTAQAGKRPLRLGGADRLPGRGDPQLRPPGLSPQGRRTGALRAPGRAAGAGAQQPGDQTQGDPAPHGRRPLPLHQTLPRHPAQPLLHHRGQRHQRDDPQLHGRRTGHHQRVGPPIRPSPARPRARADGGVPGGERQPLQPGSDPGGRHHLPLRQGGSQALARHPAGRNEGKTLLHQQFPAPRGLYRRPLRGAGHAGGAAAQVHRRHRAPPLHERTPVVGRGLPAAGAKGAGELPPALHHRHPHLLHLPEARLPGGGARILPALRRGAAGTQAVDQRVGWERPKALPILRSFPSRLLSIRGREAAPTSPTRQSEE